MGISNQGDYTQRVVGVLSPATYDKIVRTATSATVDEFEYFLDGVSVGVITVTYDDASHTNVDQAERTA